MAIRKKEEIFSQNERKEVEAECGEKMSGKKKKKERKKESVKKIGKHINFFIKYDDIKHAFFSKMIMILLVHKETCLISDDLNFCISSVVKSLL